MRAYWSSLGVLLSGRASVRFIIAVLFSFSFSIAVILATLGIMDGFDRTLKSGLRSASGDLTIYSRDGFFLDKEIAPILKNNNVKDSASLVQTEGFAVANGVSKGVLIRGVESAGWAFVTGQEINPSSGEVILGSALAKVLNVSAGDEVALLLANGNEGGSSLPLLRRFTIKGQMSHGLYDKDVRSVYMNQSELQSIMGLGNRVNMIALNLPARAGSSEVADLNEVARFSDDLQEQMPSGFVARAFWKDFSALFEAVKIEKFSITLILQVIVVVSIFNVLAFVIFLWERKAAEIFLFRALGSSLKSLERIFAGMVTLLWASSCLLAFVWLFIFNLGLKHLPFLKIPGEIYHMERLSIQASVWHYVIIFGLSFVWVLLITFIGTKKLMRKPLLAALRKEFT
jgi:ABC-type lipoprotein release transport system permease subunit